MVYDSPFPKFPPCTVPVHELVLDKIDEVIRVDPNRKAFVSKVRNSVNRLLISHNLYVGGPINAADQNDVVTYSQLREQVRDLMNELI